MHLKLLSISFLALIMIFGVVMAACSDDDDSVTETPEPTATSADTADVQVLADAMVAAWNAQNADAFTVLFTEEGLKGIFADDTVTPQVVAENAADYLSPPFDDVEVLDVSAVGDTGTFTLNGNKDGVLFADRYNAVKSTNGAWVVESYDFLPPDIPDEDTTVAVEATEFAFSFDAEAVDSGEVAFAMNNAGDQAHELFLLQVTDEFTIEALLEGGEDAEPPGVVRQVGGTFAYPGDQNNLVFTEPLASGKYVMLCFIPDADDPEGASHVAKGMHAEFEVP